MTTSMADHIARALGQTFESGARYAAVPYPWWDSFCSRSAEEGDDSGVPWNDLCLINRTDPLGDNPGNVDEEGNVILCLLPLRHDGACGSPTSTLAP